MLRLGEVLVRNGAISERERDELVEQSQRTGRPLGVLAERAGVSARAVDQAWAQQYASLARRVDPLGPEGDHQARALLSRRQAWQFRLVPVALEGGGVVVCTSPEHIVRAHRFAQRHFGPGAELVLCDEHRLLDALERFYPLAGARERALAG